FDCACAIHAMALPHVVLGVLLPAPVERNYTPPHLKHRPASLAEMRAENLTPDSNCNFCGAIDTMIRKLVEAKLPSITQLARAPLRCRTGVLLSSRTLGCKAWF